MQRNKPSDEAGLKYKPPNVFNIIEKNDILLDDCNQILNNLEEWNKNLRALHDQNSHLYLREIKIQEPPKKYSPRLNKHQKKTIDPLPIALEQLDYDFKYGNTIFPPAEAIQQHNQKTVTHYKRKQFNSKPDPQLEVNQIKIKGPDSCSARVNEIPNSISIASARRIQNPRHKRRTNKIDAKFEHLNQKNSRRSRDYIRKSIDDDDNEQQVILKPSEILFKKQINSYQSHNKTDLFEFPHLDLSSVDVKANNYDDADDFEPPYDNAYNSARIESQRKLKIRKKTIETAQSARHDRSISVPKELRQKEYKAPPRYTRFPTYQVLADHKETKLKIEKLEKQYQETMEKAVIHIKKLNRQMEKKYSHRFDDENLYSNYF